MEMEIQSVIKDLLIMPCPIYERFGIYCPGCGGTRAVMALLRGNLIESFLYHPMVLYVVILCVLLVVSRMVHLLSKKRIGYIKLSYPLALSVLGVLLIQWAVKVFLQLNYGYVIM